MLRALRLPTYRRLFAAQVVALLGTGLATVALGLTAYDLSGTDASALLGLIFTVKMIAYVGVAPVATALLRRVPRRTLLVSSDAVRALAALALPFARDLPSILLLVFLLQASSATFTPAFQGVIPHVAEDPEDYTSALALSRLAYEVEAIVSPALAALALLLLPTSGLFVGTALGFLGSALLVLSAGLPRDLDAAGDEPPTRERLVRGARLLVRTPALRPILMLNLVEAAVVAIVLVETVVIVRSDLGLGEAWVAVFLGLQGAGSIGAAAALPRLLRGRRPLDVVVPAAGTLVALAAATAGVLWAHPPLLGVWIGVLWVVIGVAWAVASTPLSLMIRDAVDPALLTEAFAGQFSLSHACWLFTYPTIGLVGAASVPAAALVGAAVGGAALLGAVALARDVTPSADPSR